MVPDKEDCHHLTPNSEQNIQTSEQSLVAPWFFSEITHQNMLKSVVFVVDSRIHPPTPPRQSEVSPESLQGSIFVDVRN